MGFLGLGGTACLLILAIPAGTVQLFYCDHNMQLKVALTDMFDRNGGCLLFIVSPLSEKDRDDSDAQTDVFQHVINTFITLSCLFL